MTRPEFEAEVRHLLAAHFPYPALVPEKLVRSLLLAADGYAAAGIEQHARTPQSQRGPGRDEGWQPVQPKRQRRERRTA